MYCKLKILGLALVALCAMSAMAASTAAAADFDVETSAGEPVTITGNQKTAYTFEFLFFFTVTCNTVDFKATANSPTVTSLKYAVVNYGCSISFGTAASITNFAVDHSEIGKAGKCWYRLDASGSAALECNGTEVTIDAGTCTIHIPPQEFKNAVTYSTETLSGGKHDLTAAFSFEKATANYTDGFLCPFEGSSHSSTAKLHGTSTVFAETEATGALRHLTWTP